MTYYRWARRPERAFAVCTPGYTPLSWVLSSSSPSSCISSSRISVCICSCSFLCASCSVNSKQQ